MLMSVRVTNAGPDRDTLHVLPATYRWVRRAATRAARFPAASF